MPCAPTSHTSFRELVSAYLSTGAGLSGVQPKIMVPERSAIPVPNLLVKVAAGEYPGLAGNEFLCLEVARRAGLAVADHSLSDDGGLLLVDRIDLDPRGSRLGFEDIAALLGLRVGGALSGDFNIPSRTGPLMTAMTARGLRVRSGSRARLQFSASPPPSLAAEVG